MALHSHQTGLRFPKWPDHIGNTNLTQRNRGQRLKCFDGAPYTKTDPFGHLLKVDHVVRKENKHRTLCGIGLPPASEDSGPTARSYTPPPHHVRFGSFHHHRNAQAKSSTS